MGNVIDDPWMTSDPQSLMRCLSCVASGARPFRPHNPESGNRDEYNSLYDRCLELVVSP